MEEKVLLFSIPQNEYVEKMKQDYAFCIEKYGTDCQECVAFRVFSELDEDERILCMAMSEYKSSRKVAEVLETNNNYASRSMKALKAKIKAMINRFMKEEE